MTTPTIERMTRAYYEALMARSAAMYGKGFEIVGWEKLDAKVTDGMCASMRVAADILSDLPEGVIRKCGISALSKRENFMSSLRAMFAEAFGPREG
jgi:hypothetical protein